MSTVRPRLSGILFKEARSRTPVEPDDDIRCGSCMVWPWKSDRMSMYVSEKLVTVQHRTCIKTLRVVLVP